MTETIAHDGRAFRVIPLDACLDQAMAMRRAGERWHSHVLSPVCRHNPYPGRYAIVLENDGAGIAYIAPSDGFPEVDKQLVKILHGDDILDASRAAAVGDAAVSASSMLRRLRALDTRGAAWHHHMHFPDCVLNPHRGQWAIAIENSEGPAFSEAYEDEPVNILREVEVLYFAKLERNRGSAGT